MNKYLASALIGSVIGTASWWLGVHGGEFIQLGLLLSGVVNTQSKAAGTTMFAMLFPVTALATWNYYKRGQIDVKAGSIIVIFFSILALFGSKLNARVPQNITLYAISVFMFLGSIAFFMKAQSVKSIS